MSYVLKNMDTGKWVTLAGLAHSYTSKLQHARKFESRDEANRNRCGNEHIQTLEEAVSDS